MTPSPTVPSPWARLRPLVFLGWAIAAIRLLLDATWPDGPITMYFGLYFGMPIAIGWVGLTGRWGPVTWRQTAGSMLLLAVLVWSVTNTVAYTTGQFMEWTFGRYHGGGPVLMADGSPVLGADGAPLVADARAAPVQPTALRKVGAGLLHGVISGAAAGVWCLLFGTLLIWLPARLRRNKADVSAGTTA